MYRVAFFALSRLGLLLTSMTAWAITAYTPVDFSGQANFTWIAPQTDPNGVTATYFPGGPSGSVTLGGIPFNISSNTAGFQAWNGYVASGGGNGEVTITMTLGVYGVTDVYTLINTYWGAAGPPAYTTLVFTGSAGATYTAALLGNSDIRNWCCAETINGTSTVNVYTVSSSPINGLPGFLDMQHITLPAIFATQTLVSIELMDKGAPGLQRTVLDGVTVASATRYNVCLLYDPAKAVKSGSTIPIKLQLCDSTGNNSSSASLSLHAVSTTQTSTSISGELQDAGNANPDDDFRFDATLGSSGGYIFNLKTTGMTTGSYNLNFTVIGDSILYTAPFQVK